MTSNADPQLKEGLARLDRTRERVAESIASATEEFRYLKALVVGLRVRRFGRLWQICEARIGLSAEIRVYGVAVRQTTKREIVGRRGYDLGSFDQCEIVE